MKTSTLLLTSLACALGILLASSVETSTAFLLFIVTLGTALTSSSLAGVVSKKTGFLVGLMIAFLVVGIIRFDAIRDRYDETVDRYTKTAGDVVLSGVVCDEVDEREQTKRITLCATILNEVTASDEFRVLITTDRFSQITYGDELSVRGELRVPEVFKTHEAGRRFDYPNYLRVRGVTHVMFRPEIESIRKEQYRDLQGLLFTLKRAYLTSLEATLPEPYAALAGGITVGSKRALGDNLLDDFRRTGLVHIVVLSGYNVAIILYALLALLRRFPPSIRFTIGGIAVTAFVLMTGAGAPIVRAALMAALVLMAAELGRPSDGGRILLMTGLVMVAHNPYLLVFDPSFQLSFVATAGLLYLKPLTDYLFTIVPQQGGLRDIVSATTATQIAVLPLLVHMTGEVSIVSLVVNLLVLPVVPIAMLLVFIAAILGFIHEGIAMLAGFTVYAVEGYMLAVVDLFASFSHAAIAVKHIGILAVALAYMTMGGFIALFHVRFGREDLPLEMPRETSQPPVSPQPN